jgi:hypothetical protein
VSTKENIIRAIRFEKPEAIPMVFHINAACWNHFDKDALIHEEVSKIATPQGGLMMIYGLYPGVPLENASALMDAMERYAGYYS